MKKVWWKKIMGIILALYPVVTLGSSSSPFGICAVWPYFNEEIYPDNGDEFWGDLPLHDHNGVDEIQKIYNINLDSALVCGLSWCRPNVLEPATTWQDAGVHIIQQRNIIPFLAIGCPSVHDSWTARDATQATLERYDGDGNNDMLGLTKPLEYLESHNEAWDYMGAVYQAKLVSNVETPKWSISQSFGSIATWNSNGYWECYDQNVTQDLLTKSLNATDGFAKYIKDMHEGAEDAAANGGKLAKIVGPVLYTYTGHSGDHWEVFVYDGNNIPGIIRIYPSVTQFWNTFLDYARNYIDVISVHEYQPNVATLLSDLDALETCLNDYCDANSIARKPIWVSETGWVVKDKRTVLDPDLCENEIDPLGHLAEDDIDQANKYMQFCREIIKRNWMAKGNKVFFFALTDWYPHHQYGEGWGILDAGNAKFLSGSNNFSLPYYFYPSSISVKPRWGLRGGGPFPHKLAFDSLQHFIFFNSDKQDFTGSNNQRKFVGDNAGNLHLVNSSWEISTIQ